MTSDDLAIAISLLAIALTLAATAGGVGGSGTARPTITRPTITRPTITRTTLIPRPVSFGDMRGFDRAGKVNTEPVSGQPPGRLVLQSVTWRLVPGGCYRTETWELAK